MAENIKRFDMSIRDFGEVNEGFIRATVNVCTKDQIANGFEFKREAIERSRKLWAYLPIKGEFLEEVGDFGSHGGKIEISDEGMKFIKTTVPMGCVIANTDRFEMVKCQNGEEKEYFCLDVYLWEQEFREEMNVFKQGENRNQSMEVMLQESAYDYDRKVEMVNAFQPLALCILGKDVAPAFKDSRVKVQFESEAFKAQYDQMLCALDKLMKFEEEKGGCHVEDKLKDTVDVAPDELHEEATGQEAEHEVKQEAKQDVHEEAIQEGNNEQVEAPNTEELPVSEEAATNYEALHMALQGAFNELKTQFDDLTVQYNQVIEEVEVLRTFKKDIEMKENESKVAMARAEKEAMLESFVELTEEEKTEAVEDVDKFSLEEIETKLSIAFARKLKANKKVETVGEEVRFANISGNAQAPMIDLLIAEVEKYKK
ncbi:MAG: hypothetical protein RSA51_07305 [Niameybacter sp.]